jgi:hypothetical protein
MAQARRRIPPRKHFEAARALARRKITAWPDDPQPGPSREQWIEWNNEHGTALRIACGVMMLSKERLARFASDQELWDQTLGTFDASKNSLGTWRRSSKLRMAGCSLVLPSTRRKWNGVRKTPRSRSGSIIGGGFGRRLHKKNPGRRPIRPGRKSPTHMRNSKSRRHCRNVAGA